MISPAIPESGDLKLGHVDVPFVVLQDTDNSLSVFIGNAIDSQRFASIEILLDDGGGVHIRVITKTADKAVIVQAIGNILAARRGD